MKAPHVLIPNCPRIVKAFGWLARRRFYAFTLFCVTFVDDDKIEKTQKAHEYRHVVQFFACWAIGLVMWLVYSRGLGALFLTPFTLNVLYGFAMLVAWIDGEHPYRGNLFERDARQYAGEPE